MAMYGVLSTPTLGMLAQGSAFGAIADNITNMSTGGYKSVDTRFKTALVKTFFDNSDVGGLVPFRVNNIEQQGVLNSTDNPLNIAISGQGLFVVNSQLDGTGEDLYTRDGAFELQNNGTEVITGNFRNDGSIDLTGETTINPFTATVDKSFLSDKNGNFVLGWEADETGFVNTAVDPISMRLDQFSFISDSAATTTADLEVTLPATAVEGDVEKFKASVFVADGDLKSLEFVWTKGAKAQEWTLSIAPVEGTSASTADFIFGTDGFLPSGTTTQVDVVWDDTQVSAITLDLTNTRSIGSTRFYTQFQKNGRSPGDLSNFFFDDAGNVKGSFSNGVERVLYKLPLATFANVNKLEVLQGNVFRESVESGTPFLREADLSFVAKLVPFFHERSNVDLGTEFQTMILVQQAYNSAATVFKVVDEMTSVAAELKA